MFKAGDDVQALDGKEWYNAKVIRVSIEIFLSFWRPCFDLKIFKIYFQRLEQELEAYEIHYKGWNKRFDCVKYSKEIRHPEVLIKDPSPSPKSKARIKAAHVTKVSGKDSLILTRSCYLQMSRKYAAAVFPSYPIF